MERLAVTRLLLDYHVFSKEFWLSYKTLEKIMDPVRFSEIKMSLLKSKRVNDKYLEEVDKTLFDTERSLLEQEWNLKNEEARQNGTAIHEQIHSMFANNSISLLSSDYSGYDLADNLLKTEKGIFSELKLEVPLEEYTLVGIIDCLIKDGNHLTIIDWKSDESIKWKSMYDLGAKRSKRMKFPIANLEDCNGVHYQLLLSIYAKMLLMINPNFVIDELRIVLIKDMKPRKSWSVEYLSQDVDKLLAFHIKNLRIKKEMEKCNPLMF